MLSIVFVISSCHDTIVIPIEAPTQEFGCEGGNFDFCLEFNPGQEEEIELALLSIENNTLIKLNEGTYNFNSLSLVSSRNIKFMGDGIRKTIIDFSGQTSGGEGIRVSNCVDFTIRDMTIKDSQGDLIKVSNSTDVVFNNLHAYWSGVPDSSNGGYGIYPVRCNNVLIDSCEVKGAADAGIYVGQTNGAIVRNSTAYRNVAGCEIENTRNADVYDNEFYDNTGGFLIFDLPNLSQTGGNIRAFNNNIHHNNYRNFAPSAWFGTTTGVGNVPPGAGIVHNATSDVEIFNNRIVKNNLTSILIVSGLILDDRALEYIGPNYYPFPRNVYIHDNEMRKDHMWPHSTQFHEFGSLIVNLHIFLKLMNFNQHPFIQHILLDGANSNMLTGGTESNPDNICIEEDEYNLLLDMQVVTGSNFLDGNGEFEDWQPSKDVEVYQCQ